MAGLDFNSLIEERLSSRTARGAGSFKQQSFSRRQRFQEILKSLTPPQEELPPVSGEFVGRATGELPGAEPEDETGFSAFNALFNLLDLLGRPVRGLVGAGTAAINGRFKESGKRLLDAALSPVDALTFDLFDLTGNIAGTGQFGTTGSQILDDLGWKMGTTTEDERRIRIAMAAGLSRRQATRKFGSVGDSVLSKEDAASFENIVTEARKRNPDIELGSTGDDLKNSIDAQDFAGFTADVLLDPLTYLTAGLSATGKAAKSLGVLKETFPKLADAIRAAKSSDEAVRLIRASTDITGPVKKRYAKEITRAWKVSKGKQPGLYLADNFGKQARAGQRGLLVTSVPFTNIGGRPLVKGGAISEVLTHIGQTKAAAQIRGAPETGSFVQRTLDFPGVNIGVGAASGVVKFLRDKFDIKTGLKLFDELLDTRAVGIRTGLTKLGRELNKSEVLLRDVAKGAGRGIGNKRLAENAISNRVDELKKVASEAIEISKQTGGDFDEAARAASVAVGISTRTLERGAIARISAGIVRINETIAGEALKVPTRLTKLNDDTIQYLHRSLTVKGRAFINASKNRTSYLKDTGLEFNARSRTFIARTDKSRGKTMRELNEAFSEKHGFDLYNSDPLAAARDSVRQTQRALTNAKFVAAVTDVDHFGNLSDDTFDFINGIIPDVPPQLLNQRQMAKDTFAAASERARVLRDARKGGKDIGEERIFGPKPQNFDLISEGPDAIGVANFFKKALKDEGLIAPGEVSAFDLYVTAGLKLPSTPEDIARLVATTVPDEIAKMVTRTVKIQKDPGPYLKVFDKYQTWMKATVTQPFAAFHGRNMLENFFKNFIEGNTNLSNYRNATRWLSQATDLNAGSPDWVGKIASKFKRAFAKGGQPSRKVMQLMGDSGIGKTFDEQADWLVANGVLHNNRITSEFGEVLQDGIAGTNNAARQVHTLGGRVAKELGTQGAVVRGGFALSAGTENLHRVSMFFDRLSKGFLPKEAAAEVKRVFFDYRALTNFESTYMRRGGLFYNFYRENARYVVGTTYTRPELTKQILKMFQSDPDNPRQRWLSDRASFTTGAQDIALGFLPQQQFNMFSLEEGDIFDKLKGKAIETLGTLNPALTTLPQAIFDKDLFTGAPLLQPTNSIDWSFAPPSIQEAIGYEVTPQGKHKISGFFNFMFKAFPVLGRFSSSTIEVTNNERTFWQKLTKLGTGVRIEDRDVLKEDLALIDRNLLRAKKGLKLIRRNKQGTFVINNTTENGRLLSAMAEPSKRKMHDLGLLDRDSFFKLKPYMTFDEDGEVILTGILRQQLHDVAVERFPKEMAFLQGVDLRGLVTKQLKDRQEDLIGAAADLRFDLFQQ